MQFKHGPFWSDFCCSPTDFPLLLLLFRVPLLLLSSLTTKTSTKRHCCVFPWHIPAVLLILLLPLASLAASAAAAVAAARAAAAAAAFALRLCLVCARRGPDRRVLWGRKLQQQHQQQQHPVIPENHCCPKDIAPVGAPVAPLVAVAAGTAAPMYRVIAYLSSSVLPYQSHCCCCCCRCCCFCCCCCCMLI